MGFKKGQDVQILHGPKKKLIPIDVSKPLTSQGTTAEIIAKINEIIEVLNNIS
jgi:hypothetical protein